MLRGHRIAAALVMMVSLVILGACATSGSATGGGERQDLLYVCNCGPECNCNSVSKNPGTCACGKDMAETHVVKVEGTEALLCTCGGGCKCALDEKDPTQCGCGKPVKRVDLEGTGLYFCNCGGQCYCNTVSDKPGVCKCGMPLKQVDG